MKSIRLLRAALRDPSRASSAAIRRVGMRLGFADSQRPAEAIAQWLQAIKVPPVSRGRLLLLAVRNHTWVEWAVYCACVIRQFGFESTIVFFGSQVDRLYPPSSRDGDFWRQVSLIPGVELIDLDNASVTTEELERWRPEAEAWSGVAVAYDEHLEETDVTDDEAHFRESRRDLEKHSARGAAALAALVANRTFDRAIGPSGLIGETHVMLSALLANNVETVLVEGWAWRPGHLIYNLNAPALEYNVEGWMRSFGEWTAEQETSVDEYIGFLDGKRPKARGWLSNFYRIQRAGIDAAPPATLRRFVGGSAPVFMLAPNVVGDSSTLRRETIFSSQQAWIRQVIQWFADRPHLKLVFRAHPAERWIGPKCRIYLADVAREAAKDAPNIFVVGSEEKLNTFSLLSQTRAGLVWMSSAGVDFVVRGRCSIVAARPKYTGLGIVEEPKTIAEYFAAIERHAGTLEVPTAEQVRRGKQYLHMVFRGFSFEATGRNFRATGCTLGKMPNQTEHDRFYRILVGDETMPDVSVTEPSPISPSLTSDCCL